MKKYISFFKIRAAAQLQYRAAALAGIATQFAWGGMLLMLYNAFYRSTPQAMPMPYQQLSSYIWLQQALLVLFIAYRYDADIVDSITSGGIAYDLIRPVDLYSMWFAKDVAVRLTGAFLRFAPVIIFAFFLPEPYGLRLPESAAVFVLFLASLILGVLNTAAYMMLSYVAIFHTLSKSGVSAISVALTEFLSGQIIPLPFFPDRVRQVFELLPFATMQNVPLRVYIGELQGGETVQAILLQIFWLIVMTAAGRYFMGRITRRAVVQGG